MIASVESVASQTSLLLGALVVGLPSGRLEQAWRRASERWEAGPMALYVAALLTRGPAGLELTGGPAKPRKLTVEIGDRVVTVRTLGLDRAVAGLFDRQTPLGLASLHVEQLASSVGARQEQTARGSVASRGERLLAYVSAHASDPESVLARVAAQTEVPLGLLQIPDRLSDEQFAVVAGSVRRIVGVAADL